MAVFIVVAHKKIFGLINLIAMFVQSDYFNFILLNINNEIDMIDATKTCATVLNVCQTVYQLAMKFIILTFVAVVIMYNINRLLDINVDFNWQVDRL